MTRNLLTVEEASRELGVKPETVYAYVSRGLLRRQRRPGSRASWFDPGEVDRLASRGRQETARHGREIRIESAVTSIEGERYFYRGHDPAVLARTVSFERVAELLWTGELPATTSWRADAAAVRIGRAVQRVLPRGALPFDRVRLVAAALAGSDPFRHELRREAVVHAARRLLPSLVESLPAHGRSTKEAGFASRLWSRVSPAEPTAAQLSALDGALVLLADHELAASTFAVRIAAALRADPYGVVGAGFGVLGGALHGAVSLAAEALLREIGTTARVGVVIDGLLRRGEKLPGVGHPIYPGGDPRATALLALVRDAGGDRRRLKAVDALLGALGERGLPPPNVDLGVAALSFVFGFEHGAGELVFALARSAGWIAHAIEEYEAPSTLRPRAVYTGVRPSGTAASD